MPSQSVKNTQSQDEQNTHFRGFTDPHPFAGTGKPT